MSTSSSSSSSSSHRIYTFIRSKLVQPLTQPLPLICLLTGSVAVYFINKSYQYGHMLEKRRYKPRSSEIRFINFASVQYAGQVYMTPSDFLESILEITPKKRHRRRKLTTNDLNDIRRNTPLVTHSNPHFFRALHRKGIISYTEYLFLLSALIKSQSKFKLAFDMIDINSNGMIEKSEYLILENIFTHSWKMRGGTQSKQNEYGLHSENSVDTTLCFHFFGSDGNLDLAYENFEQFSLNLQQEVLEVEFTQFSHGSKTISHTDFAKIVMRYTYLDMEDYEDYIDTLIERLEHLDGAGVTFEEFQSFINFLNHLGDFSLTTRMYILMQQPITKEEFQKMVKICMGSTFTQNLVDTLFAIFDKDGDGLLSYKEFLYVMKDRLHRGFRKQVNLDPWQEFGMCVQRELNAKNKDQISTTN